MPAPGSDTNTCCEFWTRGASPECYVIFACQTFSKAVSQTQARDSVRARGHGGAVGVAAGCPKPHLASKPARASKWAQYNCALSLFKKHQRYNEDSKGSRGRRLDKVEDELFFLWLTIVAVHTSNEIPPLFTKPIRYPHLLHGSPQPSISEWIRERVQHPDSNAVKMMSGMLHLNLFAQEH